MSSNDNPLDSADPTDGETPKVLTPSAIEAIERAEVDIAIATAKRYPRDLGIVKRDMREMATRDPQTAAGCTYALPRANKEITGPSVRMAEIAFSAYGNLSAGTRVVFMGDDTVTCQAVCHDLQKNNRLAIEIPRNVYPSKKAKTDEEKAAALRDAKLLTALAAAKIAFREVIFGIIPRSLVTPIWREAQEVAAGKGRSFEEARGTAVAEFRKIGVGPKQLCDYLGVGGIEAITTAHLQLLFGVLTAIQDGDTSVEAEFGPRQKQAKEPVKAQVPETKPVTAPPPAPEPPAPEPPKPEEEAKPAPVTTPAPSPPKPDAAPQAQIPFMDEPAPTKKKPPAKKETEEKPLDPVYAKVAKRIESSKISIDDFLRVMRYWGVADEKATSLQDVRVGAMRTADNDWQAILDELLMNPEVAHEASAG